MNPVTYRTFEDDGYHDGLVGLEPRPPDPYNGSKVYAEEYMRGYRMGQSFKPNAGNQGQLPRKGTNEQRDN